MKKKIMFMLFGLLLAGCNNNTSTSNSISDSRSDSSIIQESSSDIKEDNSDNSSISDNDLSDSIQSSTTDIVLPPIVVD